MLLANRTGTRATSSSLTYGMPSTRMEGRVQNFSLEMINSLAKRRTPMSSLPSGTSRRTPSSSASIPTPKQIGSDGSTGRKVRRAIVKRKDLAGKDLPAHMRLRAQKVSQQTLNRYLTSIHEFERWVAGKKVKLTTSNLDRQVTLFLTHLQEDLDSEVSAGTYLVYGLQLLRCTGNKSDFLTESKEALKGWRKRRPGNMRLPVPEEFVYDLATLALDQNRVDLAMLLTVQMDAYLRPSEALDLTKAHLARPNGRRYPLWGLVVAPADLGDQTKTGTSDDSVLLGDTTHNKWLGPAFTTFVNSVPDSLFGSINLASYEKWLQSACQQLQYKTTCVMPHVLRHTGASNDVYHKRRSLLDVQRRGRWKAKSSVSRYEKHALLVQRWGQASVGRHADSHQRSQDFPAKLLRALRFNGGPRP